jgi:hypothetical protein
VAGTGVTDAARAKDDFPECRELENRRLGLFRHDRE